MNYKNIWLQVFTYLDQKEISYCEMVCSNWQHYLNSDSIQMRQIFNKCYCMSIEYFKWFSGKLKNVKLKELEFFLGDDCLIPEQEIVDMISPLQLERFIIKVLSQDILELIFKNLQSLQYFETRHTITNNQLKLLSDMEDLRYLHIRVQKQEDENLIFCIFRNLFSISLAIPNLDYQGDVQLMLANSFDTLRELELEAEYCSSEYLLILLETLNQKIFEKLYLFYFEDYNDEILYRLSQFHQLKKLQIRKAKDISESAMHQLVLNKSFIELNLDQCEGVTDNVLYTISKSSHNLQIINVSWNQNISDEVVAILLKNCKYLKEVYLIGCKQLTNKCIPEDLYGLFSQLRILDFEQCNDMNDDELKLLKSKYRYVKIINFYGYEIE